MLKKMISFIVIISICFFAIIGCEKVDIIQSNGSNSWNFYVGDVNFNYERYGNHNGHMKIYNANSVRVYGNVRQCEDSDCDIFDGNDFDLREDRTCEYDAYYPPDENIQITMNYNGKYSKNLILLGKLSLSSNEKLEIVDMAIVESTKNTLVHYTIKLLL